jgi:hypothetical protein
MFKTNPIFTIVTIAAVLALAYGMPAFRPLPSIAETAGGLHLALLVLSMMVLRVLIENKPDLTWPEAIGVPLAIIAGAVALGVLPDDSMNEVVHRAGWIAFLVSAGAAGAAYGQWPQGWGKFSRRDGLICLSLGLGLLAWNHLYQFPEQAGLAITFDLVGLALLWNIPKFAKTARRNLPQNAAWAHRLAEAACFTLWLGYLFASDWFFYGLYNPALAAVIVISAICATMIMLWFEDRLSSPKDA